MGTQRGADAVLVFDLNVGTGREPLVADYVTFRNVDASALTAADLDGIDPHGGKTVGKVITGTALARTIATLKGAPVLAAADLLIVA